MYNISTRYSIENDTIYCLKMMNVMEICLMKTAIELCRKKHNFVLPKVMWHQTKRAYSTLSVVKFLVMLYTENCQISVDFFHGVIQKIQEEAFL